MNMFKRIASFLSLFAAVSAFAQSNDNWVNSTGINWKSGAGDLCWRSASWTPATADQDCDGAIKPAAPAAPPPAPVAKAAPPVAAPPPPPRPAPPPPVPTSEKVTFSADTFFDFDKASLKPDGQAKLDKLAEQSKGVDIEVVVATGHTDATGPESYNQGLSIRRAESVKAYLVGKGMDKSKIFTEGKGETQPVADNKTRDGRAQNRRVVIEVVGTRTKR